MGRSQNYSKLCRYFRLEKNLAENIVRIIRGYYNEPKRNNLTFAIAGFLHKARVSEEIIAEYSRTFGNSHKRQTT